MRCRQAQRLMTPTVDNELEPRQQHALDQHLTACAACRQELAATRTLLEVVARLPGEMSLPPRLEEVTLHRMRDAARAERSERRPAPWWRSLSLPALTVAAVAVLALAVGLRQFDVVSTRSVDIPGRLAAKSGHQAASQHQVASEAARTRVARQEPRRASEPPKYPPAELASAPDLFMDLPILRHMEKLEHFDAIRTTTVDEAPDPSAGQQERSSG